MIEYASPKRSPRRRASLFLLLAAIAATASQAHAAGWRNDGTGKFPQADPPATWSATEGIVWKTPLPAWGNATPAISGDRIFLTAEPNSLLCVSKADGKILWTKTSARQEIMTPEEIEEAKQNAEKVKPFDAQIRDLEKQKNDLRKIAKDDPQYQDAQSKIRELDGKTREIAKQKEPLLKFAPSPTSGDNGYASATPVTDGKTVFEVFGSGIAVAYDFDGNRKWIRFLEKPREPSGWGFCTSPLLADGKLIVHINDMQALDPATGQTLWTTQTPWAFGTSAIAKIGNSTVAVTPKGAIVRISDGKVLASNLFVMDYGSPIVENGVIYEADQGHGAATARAFRLPAAIPPEIASDPKAQLQVETLWSTPVKNDRYYASPILYDGILYVASGNGQNFLCALDAATGQVLWEQKSGTGAHIYTSYSLAGKNLYISGEDKGTMIILQPGRQYKELARIDLEKTRANPVFDGSRMYIRGFQNLYCVGK